MPGRGYIEGQAEQLDLRTILSILYDLQAKSRAVVVFQGETDGAGAVDGSSLICSELIGLPDFDGARVVILSGDYAGQSRVIDGTTTAGVVNPSVVFGGQIQAQVEFAVLTAGGGGAVIVPDSGETIAAWNAAEADVVTVGADNVNNKIHSFIIDITNCIGTITIRMYSQVNGVERQIYIVDASVALDGPSIWLINSTTAIHEELRITCESDNPADDGQAIAYDYMIEEV